MTYKGSFKGKDDGVITVNIYNSRQQKYLLVFNKIENMLREYTYGSGTITPNTKIREMGLDSLDLLDFAQKLEIEFGKTATQTQIDKMITINDIVVFILGEEYDNAMGGEIIRDLVFTGESPVVINYNGSVEDIYNSLRTSSLDLNIVDRMILDDLYTAQIDSIAITVEKDGNMIWEGYLTPNIFSQTVSQNLDMIDMTFIDPLSILKYIKIDKLMNKPKIMTYGELLGLSLSQVKLNADKLYVERTVSYDNIFDLLGMTIQVANFWDEGNEPDSVHNMLVEMLKLFNLTLTFSGTAYYIYDVSRVNKSEDRIFDEYQIADNGVLRPANYELRTTNAVWGVNEWVSQNVNNSASIDINTTYDKITGIASTKPIEYNDSPFDQVSVYERDKYDAYWLNVMKNKSRGYVYDKYADAPKRDNDAHWEYIWNGVYVNDRYGLESETGLVNPYLNINNAYRYLTGSPGYPDDYGSILAFYGGKENKTATGKAQENELGVEIKRSITSYARDNGIVPEFLDPAHLEWNVNLDNSSGHNIWTLSKSTPSNSYYGEVKADTYDNNVLLHQAYEAISLMDGIKHVASIEMNHTFSRTGMDHDIELVAGNSMDRKEFWLNAGGSMLKYDATLDTGHLVHLPDSWNSKNVVVDGYYYGSKRVDSGNVEPIWDKTRVDLYVKVRGDFGVYQFNGKNWIYNRYVSHSNSFYLCKLLNNQKLFHNKFEYDVIETGDGFRYALLEDGFSYEVDDKGGVVAEDGHIRFTYRYYMSETEIDGTERVWLKNIEDCGPGKIEIRLPDNLPADSLVDVVIDVHNSNMIGTVGNTTHIVDNHDKSIYYEISGTGKTRNPSTGEITYRTMTEDNVNGYGELRSISARENFMPINVSYVKAEHADVDIALKASRTNLGQMFSESDVKYSLDSKKKYAESFDGPTFNVNTRHQLVHGSFSYVMFNNYYADYNLFAIGGIVARPECYVVQAYANWLSNIRKIYTKTLRTTNTKGRELSNLFCYIDSPELYHKGDLMIVSDSWDVKSGRHSIVAVEDYDLQVDKVATISVVEVPRKARNELYNLPSAKKE